MTDRPLELRCFGQADFAQLIAQVPDAGFLLQWSGPEWSFPLDFRQLREALAKTRGKQPAFKIYKAVLPGGAATVGHVQLMDIDYDGGTCVLGRVLIFPHHRGTGLGKPLVGAAMEEAFAGLGLREVSLKVFAFNQPALRTYEGLGFTRSTADPEFHELGGTSLEVLNMALRRERWLELTWL
jgi:RimJ/RimL family protein N-acetyltransferase